MPEPGRLHIKKLLRNTVLVLLAVVAVFLIMRTTTGIRDRDVAEALMKVNPHMTVYSLTGDTADIRTLGGGKPFIVVYFSPDCEYCQDEATRLREHLEEFGGTGIVMLSLENREATVQFSRDYKLGGQSGVQFYLDARHQFPVSFGTHGYPVVLVYNQAGQLTRIFQGETGTKEILRAVRGG